MLDKQQKILQMAKDICRYQPCCNDVCKPISACDALKYAERAVEAGYCKQSTGCEYCATDNEKCGTCIKFFDYYKDGGSDRCYTTHNSEKCAYYEPINFCPNCGAKMKGGDKK